MEQKHNAGLMKSFDLRNYLITFPNVLSQEYCESFTEKLKNQEWTKHAYHNSATDQKTSYDDDLHIHYLDDDDTDNRFLMETVYKVLMAYYRQIDLTHFNSWAGYSQVRINKYSKNTRMRKHFDGIKSIFDGKLRGDPTLSVLGALNDDYEGGELMFWNDTKIELKAGNVMVFPSTFLYPHSVEPVTKGTRYSFVSWVY